MFTIKIIAKYIRNRIGISWERFCYERIRITVAKNWNINKSKLIKKNINRIEEIKLRKKLKTFDCCITSKRSHKNDWIKE